MELEHHILVWKAFSVDAQLSPAFNDIQRVFMATLVEQILRHTSHCLASNPLLNNNNNYLKTLPVVKMEESGVMWIS